MTLLDFNLSNLTTLFREIGLYSSGNKLFQSQTRKHQQILAYLQQFQSIFGKFGTKKPLVLLDCGCGKSYLSFVLYEYCRSVLKREIKIIGIDWNPELIRKCQNSAESLGFNMEFISSTVNTFQTKTKVDIIYSLHACDKATDQTIATGINLGARYILSVSCCQHTNREKISNHPLTSISRHKPYKERLVDMIGDSMRALLLESIGYRVDIFEFIATNQTPKNIMLRAIKDTAKKERRDEALTQYHQLVNMFNFAPELERLLMQ